MSTIIYFLPTLLNELLHLLVITSNEDVALNTVRVLIHIVHGVHEAGKNDILHSYVQVFNVFQCFFSKCMFIFCNLQIQ